jgi:hypothetical protein
MQCVPCILHMEMRIGIKILHTILMEGLKNAIAGVLPMVKEVTGYKQSCNNKKANIYLQRMHTIITQSIWGTGLRPAQWGKIPYNQKKRNVSMLFLWTTKVHVTSLKI